MSSNKVYENRFISVFDEVVLAPTGQTCSYGRVHFKKQAVGVLCRIERSILLVGQHRYPTHRYSWEIPEGGTEPNELPVQAAVRELWEETGYRVEESSLEDVFTICTSNSVTDEQIVIYRVEIASQALNKHQPGGVYMVDHDDGEQISSAWIDLDEALSWIQDGRITDGPTVCAILHEATYHREPHSH